MVARYPRVALLAFLAACGGRATTATPAPPPAAGAAAPTATAAAAPNYAAGDPVPAHDSLTLPSRALGEARRINVHVPPGYASSPTRRYAVLYMPDGGLDEDFPHVVATVDSLVALGAIPPTIVVGIPNTQRRRDLTGPTRFTDDSAIAPRVGGSAAFRAFIRDELVPAIDARYRTGRPRAIMGESLAGLFVVETFLAEPALFDRWIAFDPSLWWNGGLLVDSAGARLAALDRAPRTPRVLWLGSSDVKDIAGGTARLAEALRAASPMGLRWTYAPRPDLTHATIFRALKPRALVETMR